MPVATALALVTAVLNLTVATGHVAISRAPGWGVARLFAVIAATAALYSAGNVIYTLHDLPIGVYMFALRLQYLLATLHMLAWMPFAFGREDFDFRKLPFLVRVWCLLCAVMTVFLGVTGWHVTGPLHHLRIEWADVTYHYLSATGWGHAYAAIITVGMLLPLIQFARRASTGERGMALVLAGYSAFFVSVIIEALVASEVIDFFSPADLGFLCSVIPTSALLVRRFVDEAGQLRDLTGKLRGEVRDRTQERDRAQTALVESERHASLGRLAAGVGHEINNPLAYIRLALERMGDDLSHTGAAAQVWESIGQAHDGINRIQKVVEGLRTYSRRADDKEPQDPREVVRAAMKVANPNLRHVAQLDTDLSSAPMVMGDEARLVQALVNLLVNAAQAVAEREGAGHVHVRTGTTRAGEAFIEVEDDGPGIRESDHARLGEPYFTTRGPGGGLGLGLFVTRGIVDAHGGRLQFESHPGKGTRARMVLPALQGAAAPGPEGAPELSPPDAAPAPAPGAPLPRILIVDDEPLVLRLLGKALEPEWKVTFAADGAEALLRIQRESFDLVLCDLMMPGISGMGLAEEVHNREPRLRDRMVFMTGGAVTPASESFLARKDVICVSKPLDMRQLMRLLRETHARAVSSQR